MTNVSFELLVIALLIGANAIFAMSEMAIVRSRRSRLQDWAAKGNRRARTALELSRNLNQFLSTVQIGITVIGIFAGAFGGRTLANQLAAHFGEIQAVKAYADALGVAVVVIAITYFSVVFGELVPKRIAIAYAERIATYTAGPMLALSRLSHPLVWLLSTSTDVIFKLLGSRPSAEPPVTDEEIKSLIQQGTEAGIFEASEQDMIEAVISLGDKSARALMTPRTQIVWLDTTDSFEEIRTKIIHSGHSRFPVCKGTLDEVLGIVQTKDLLRTCLEGNQINLAASAQPAAFVPRTMTALQVLEQIKASGSHLVLVVDEYGSVEGLLTHHDVLEAIAGEIPFSEKGAEPKAVQRHDGSWLLDGMLGVDEFKELFGLESLPGEKKDAYQTLGGFLFTQMGRVPSVADRYDWQNLRFEIVDMDGKRIDKVLVTPTRPRKAAGAPE